jgi:hypothetical protein
LKLTLIVPLPKPTANTSPKGLYLQHSTYSSQSLELDRLCLLCSFFSTYTTFANSKSPSIRCFGRVSTILVVDIRRARVPSPDDNDASLPANEIEPRRPPNRLDKS